MVARTSESGFGRHEDAAPVEMLASLFEARGWPFEFVSDDEITGLEIPTGQPIVYELDANLAAIDRYYLSER